MVNIRLAMIGKRPKLTFPRLAARRQPEAVAPARGLFQRRRASPCPARSISARRSAPVNEIAGPALIQEHGTTTVLFERDTCTVAPSGELIITVGGACNDQTTARSRHARSDPQRAARGRQRDGDRPAAHLLQHDDLRGARLLHRAHQHRGRADLPERRRRLALRRRPRRHHHRRHEALRQGRLRAGRRHHHQSSGGRRPAPQQRRHLHALLLQGRAADVRHGARALDRRRRHEHRLRRRPDRGRSLARGAAARPAQDLRGRQARRDALSRAQGQHPLSGILARRHEIADGGLPAGRAAHGRAVRQIRPRHHPRGDRADLRRDRDQVPQRGVASSPTASTRRAPRSTRTASSAASRCPSTPRSPSTRAR